MFLVCQTFFCMTFLLFWPSPYSYFSVMSSFLSLFLSVSVSFLSVLQLVVPLITPCSPSSPCSIFFPAVKFLNFVLSSSYPSLTKWHILIFFVIFSLFNLFWPSQTQISGKMSLHSHTLPPFKGPEQEKSSSPILFGGYCFIYQSQMGNNRELPAMTEHHRKYVWQKSPWRKWWMDLVVCVWTQLD